MRSLIRVALVCLVLVLIAGNSLAGPFRNFIENRRERAAARSGSCTSGGCTPSYGAAAGAGGATGRNAAEGSCPGGRCPLPR